MMFLIFHWVCNTCSPCRVRTSSGTFLPRGRDKIVQRIEKRIADFTFIPVGKHFSGTWCRHWCIRGDYLHNFCLRLGGSIITNSVSELYYICRNTCIYKIYGHQTCIPWLPKFIRLVVCCRLDDSIGINCVITWISFAIFVCKDEGLIWRKCKYSMNIALWISVLGN